MIDKVLLDLLLEHILKTNPDMMNYYGSTFAVSKGYKPELLWAVKYDQYDKEMRFKAMLYLGPTDLNGSRFNFLGINVNSSGGCSIYDLWQIIFENGNNPKYFRNFLNEARYNPEVIWAA